MPRLIIPPGRKTGCLPSRHAPGTVCATLRETIDLLPPDEVAARIGKVSLSPYAKPTLDQNGVGSCGAESAVGLLTAINRFSGKSDELLNPWFVYHTTSGGADHGSGLAENLAFLRKHGAPRMSVWPRSKGWRTAPSPEAWEDAKRFRIDEYYQITSIEEIQTALVLGFGITYGWQGHSCFLTELVSMTRAKYKNSWGADWGDNGFGEINLREVDFRYDCFAYRTTN